MKKKQRRAHHGGDAGGFQRCTITAPACQLSLHTISPCTVALLCKQLQRKLDGHSFLIVDFMSLHDS